MIAAAGWALALLPGPVAASPAGPAPVHWRWQAPSVLRSVAWPDSEAGMPESLDPESPLRLSPDRIALVPVNAGDQVRVSGRDVQLGFASGAREAYPDVITWQSAPSPSIVRVPTWSSSRFLALRVSEPQEISVQVSARVTDSLATHRLDARVYAWLRGQATKPPPGNDARDRRSLLALQGLQRLWQSALPDGSPEAASAQGEAAGVLHAFWLDRQLRQERLPEPFFVTLPSVVSGGQPAEAVAGEPDGDDWRLLGANEALSVPTHDADVVSVQARARALGQTRVQVFSGELLVHDTVFRIPRRAEAPDRFTPSRVLRVVSAGQASVRVVVVEGSALVQVNARSAEHGLLETPAAHRPSALRRAGTHLPPSAPAWLRELVAFRRERSLATLEQLERRLASAELAVFGPGERGAASRAAVALLLYAGLPALTQRPSLVSHLGRFWSATAPLPAAERTALRIALLERLQDTLPEPLFAETCPASFDATRESPAEPGVESQLLRTLLETVVGTRDGQRPEPMLALERLAARHAHDPHLIELTRGAWYRGAPWTALRAPEATQRMLQRRPFDANQASGLCQNRGSRGLRWWIVPRTASDLEVLDLGGTHTALRFLAVDPDDLRGAEIQIDDQLIRVQPALDASSTVAVRPGRHRITQRSGGTLLARVPRPGASPCEELVEMERWFALTDEMVFQLPPGTAGSVASVLVDPSSLPPQGARVELSVGGQLSVAWLRSPASGDIELEVPAGATELRVRSDQPLLVRARARMHPRAPRPPTPLELRPDATQPELLLRVARLTTALKSSLGDSERRALRSERAEALHALGYPELAEMDWVRAGQPGTARRKSSAGALFLPESPQPVVPLGLPARAPLLPLGAPTLLARALEQQRLGRGDRALALLLDSGAARASDVTALLTAELASEQGDAATAASVFERLAHAHANGALFDAAAREYDHLATRSASLEHARRAFILAKLADQHGSSANGIVSRYGRAVEWRAPSLSTLGGSSVRVESSVPDPPTASLGSELRRALLLAPPEAWLLSSEASFNVRRWREQTLHVTSLCFSREGPEEGCQAEWLLDGELLSCPSEPEADHQVATSRACVIPLGAHARALSVRLPDGEARLGWVRLERVTPGHEAPGHEAPGRAPLVWQQSYAALGSSSPIRLHVSGPSALRVEARALGVEPSSLRLSDRLLTEPGASRPSREPAPVRELAFSADESGAALAVTGTDRPAQPVSPSQRLEYVIADAGLHELTLAASTGSLLVRPEVAEVVALPPARELEAPPAPPGTAPPPPPPEADTARQAPGLTWVAEPLAGAPLSLSAELTLRDRDLAEGDDDAGDRYAESALVARKTLFDDRLWLELAGFHRTRPGASSLGAGLAAGSSPEGFWPGLFTSGRLVAQPALDARGFIGSIGARHRVALGPRMNLLPALSASWRVTEPEASARADVDADVYSAYASRRPYSFDAEAVLAHRAFTDFLGRYALSARLNQDLRGFDRIELESELNLLPGSGYAPWLALDLAVSHRPTSVLREHAFTRLQVAPAASVWHWLGAGQRLRTEARFSLFVDVPNPSGSRAGVFGSLLLAYDFWLGGGLGDFRTSARFYRARQEEEGPPQAPGAAANDTYWREAPEP